MIRHLNACSPVLLISMSMSIIIIIIIITSV